MNTAERGAAWGLEGPGVKKRWWKRESVVVIVLIDVKSLMTWVFLNLNRGIIVIFGSKLMR